MNRNTLVIVLVAAFLVASGMAWFIMVQNQNQAATTVVGTDQEITTVEGAPGDRDGDGVPDFSDYYSINPDL